MFIEASVFRGDEGLSHVLGDGGDRHVDATNVLKVAEQAPSAIVDVAAFSRMEGADLGWRRATGEAAGAEPGVEHDDAGAGEGEQAEPGPVSPEPDRRRVSWISAQALAEQRGAFAERCDGHAVAVVSTLGALMLLILLALKMPTMGGTVFAPAGFWPLLAFGHATRQ